MSSFRDILGHYVATTPKRPQRPPAACVLAVVARLATSQHQGYDQRIVNIEVQSSEVKSR